MVSALFVSTLLKCYYSLVVPRRHLHNNFPLVSQEWNHRHATLMWLGVSADLQRHQNTCERCNSSQDTASELLCALDSRYLARHHKWSLLSHQNWQLKIIAVSFIFKTEINYTHVFVSKSVLMRLRHRVWSRSRIDLPGRLYIASSPRALLLP